MQYKQYTIALLGADDISQISHTMLEETKLLGESLAMLSCVLATNASAGLPLWGVIGAREAGGIAIGFSPASSAYEHLNHFRLPLEHHTTIVYTGFGHFGRDVIMVRSADVVVLVRGQHDPSLPLLLTKELQKPILVLDYIQDAESLARDLGDMVDHAEIYTSKEELTERIRELSKGE